MQSGREHVEASGSNTVTGPEDRKEKREKRGFPVESRGTRTLPRSTSMLQPGSGVQTYRLRVIAASSQVADAAHSHAAG